MNQWMCNNCGFYFEGTVPPKYCPGCKEICVFNNVSNYLPNTGEWQINQVIAGFTTKDTGVIQTSETAKRTPPALEVIPPVYIFGSLTEEQRQKIRDLEQTVAFSADSIIFKQGMKAHQMYLVEEGRVSLYYEISPEKRIPVTVVSTQGAFGWSALVRPHQFTATARALCNTRLNTIDREALLSLMRNDPKMGLLIMQDIAEVIARRLRSLEEEMSGLVHG